MAGWWTSHQRGMRWPEELAVEAAAAHPGNSRYLPHHRSGCGRGGGPNSPSGGCPALPPRAPLPGVVAELRFLVAVVLVLAVGGQGVLRGQRQGSPTEASMSARAVAGIGWFSWFMVVLPSARLGVWPVVVQQGPLPRCFCLLANSLACSRRSSAQPVGRCWTKTLEEISDAGAPERFVAGDVGAAD